MGLLDKFKEIITENDDDFDDYYDDATGTTVWLPRSGRATGAPPARAGA